ncbi:DUF4236 domain-containing protein [Tersicoccus sp. MR15.9]|uniref:DUF4236 domain-containing protein n=1 Tax=Tersicoccus mangrovi TaxID=3121635 RepID=UPI002FE6AE9E
MALQYRRRQNLGNDTWINYSGSGASVSKRFGPFTINSRGHVHIRLGGGFSWRIL